ncbi:MAG TPA: endonuclease/exonuclease/phosphatase family protein [Bryobacteraceae bacterium]|jgi:endonuclease/exonuclease/phosphatase family metal-dependent hydrolase|nr:endonuclease/exonuclease/phosphatase family protein [Bryobacteraceae bacterium]
MAGRGNAARRLRAGLGGLTFTAALALHAAAQQPLDEIHRGNFFSGTPPGRELRILDWNIDRGFRYAEILNGIRRLAPDVCLLQEVDLHAARSGGRDVAADLARDLQMNYVFAPEFRELGQGREGSAAYHGQAILSRLPILNARILRFTRQSGFWKARRYVPNWSLLQRREGGRMALVAELDSGPGRLVVYDVHLESRSLGRIQYRQLIETVEDSRRYGADAGIVLAGDLNTKYYPSLFARVMDRAGFVNCLGGVARTHVFAGALDWIFVRGPVTAEEGRVFRDVHGSDHFPLLARIRRNIQ